MCPREKRPFWADFLAYFLALSGGVALFFLARIFVAQAVGPSGKGVWVLVLLAYRQAVEFLSFGVQSALFYYVGRGLLGRREASLSALVLAMLLSPFSASFVLGMASLTLKTSLGSLGKWVFAFALLTFPALFLLYLEMLAIVEGRLVEISLLKLTLRLFHAVGAFLCFLFTQKVDFVLFAGVMAELAYFAIVTVFFSRWGLLPTFFRLRFNWAWARSLVFYGLKGHIGTIFQSLNYRLDLYLLAFFFSAREVGLYSVAVGFSELLWLVPNALGMVIGQRAVTSEWEKANRITVKVTRLMLGGLLVLCFLWPFLAKILIPKFFGGAFQEATGAVLWLMPGVWLLSLWKNLMNDISSRGYPQLKTYTSGAALIVTLTLDFLLIPTYGIKGAAVASSGAYGVAALFGVFLYSKVTGVKFRDFFNLAPPGDGKKGGARNGTKTLKAKPG